MRYSVVPEPLMSPLNFCLTVALVTFGPVRVPAGFSCQSVISKPPLAISFIASPPDLLGCSARLVGRNENAEWVSGWVGVDANRLLRIVRAVLQQLRTQRKGPLMLCIEVLL